ncbi:hypothetical protein Q0A17_00350 [Citrobacter sp. S2-9]|uniref:Uncharacterized protein n=1 Tax=Citrobacter enshiensis TaxID=2971264 RepID=A0ABT8PQ19_9ENTR|nr:hypothetical protein [Citrobacter enshiensis]MDN8597876.1 hypothetical protein [Citrobacter enshiensis]
MKSWKNRGFKKRALEYVYFFSIAPFLAMFFTLSENRLTMFIFFFTASFYFILIACEFLTKRGLNKAFKEFFNLLWNYETAFVFCYGLYTYLYKIDGQKTLSNVITAMFSGHPWTLIFGIGLLVFTVIFRFALSVTDLLVEVKPDI